MRHRILVDARKFSLMLDEVIRAYVDECCVMKEWDEILFKADEGIREALFTITHIDYIFRDSDEESYEARVCSIRLEKWAKGNTIPDNEEVMREPPPNLGRCN